MIALFHSDYNIYYSIEFFSVPINILIPLLELIDFGVSGNILYFNFIG